MKTILFSSLFLLLVGSLAVVSSAMTPAREPVWKGLRARDLSSCNYCYINYLFDGTCGIFEKKSDRFGDWDFCTSSGCGCFRDTCCANNEDECCESSPGKTAGIVIGIVVGVAVLVVTIVVVSCAFCKCCPWYDRIGWNSANRAQGMTTTTTTLRNPVEVSTTSNRPPHSRLEMAPQTRKERPQVLQPSQ